MPTNFVGKMEGKRPRRSPWHNGKKNIEMCRKETGTSTVWSGSVRLTKREVTDARKKDSEPLDPIKCGEFLD
jgi:hypothetical protein